MAVCVGLVERMTALFNDHVILAPVFPQLHFRFCYAIFTSTFTFLSFPCPISPLSSSPTPSIAAMGSGEHLSSLVGQGGGQPPNMFHFHDFGIKLV